MNAHDKPSNQRVDLQELRHIAREVGQNMSHSMEDDIEQAADEIERLTKSRDDLMQGYKNFVDDAAEREERLRAALRGIAAQPCLNTPLGSGCGKCATCFARKTLEAAPRDETKAEHG